MNLSEIAYRCNYNRKWTDFMDKFGGYIHEDCLAGWWDSVAALQAYLVRE